MGIPKSAKRKVSASPKQASASKAKAAGSSKRTSASGQSARSRSRSASQESKPAEELTPLQRRFLTAISQTANITQAAELAGVDRSSHYRWLREAAYRRAFLEARESALDRLELEAWKRATAGSDRLLLFLLSSYRPRFRPETPPVGPVYHELAEMSDEELLAQARRELKDMGYESLEDLWGGGNE